MYKGPWDCQGVNIGSRWKELYGEKLFLRPEKVFWREINTILS